MRRLMLLSLATSGLALACGAILDLPDPTVIAGFGPDGDVIPLDGTTNDGTYPDGYVPPTDGPPMNDGGSNDVVSGPPCGSSKLGCFGGACTADVCQPVAIYTVLDPKNIDNDGTKLYFASGAQIIDSLDPNNVDAGLTTLTNGESFITDLHVYTDGYVYFTNQSGSAKGAFRCQTSNCGSTRTAFVKGGSNTPYGISTDGTNAYITYNDLQASGGGIYQCAVGGCSLSPTHVPGLSSGLGLPGLVAVDSTNLYWFAGPSNFGVYSCPKGSCPSPKYNTDTGVVDLTVDATNVYWVNGQDVYMRPLASGSPTQIAGSQAGSSAIRVDGSYVYWLNNTGGTLARCPIGSTCTGSSPVVQTLASGLTGAFGLTLTSDSAYFTTTGGSGTIWRVAK